MPIAVLYGAHYRTLNPLVHGEALRVPLDKMRLEYVKGAGRLPPLTVPDRVAPFVHEVVASIREFVS